MRELEKDLLRQIEKLMQEQGKTQVDFARSKGIQKQAIHPYFKGKKSLLTGTGKDLLEFLKVRIMLVPQEEPSEQKPD